jgi:hypothetical protein
MVAVSFIGEGNQRKPPTCHKSLTKSMTCHRVLINFMTILGLFAHAMIPSSKFDKNNVIK